ncbi:MAG TPA: murein L,D-transpeptidase catalytic domain family protein [Rhodanobacter sp.]
MADKFLALSSALAIAVCVSSLAVAATSPRTHSRAAQSVAARLPDSQQLARLAPAADPKVLELALAAVHCAQADGVGATAQRLAVIDYSRSSLQPRLWVFDLASHKLLYRELVAHGRGSGGDLPTHFSNQDDSHESSLGLFVTRDTYTGHNGYSLRMAGLERGINDAAMARAIVMHGAAYVNADSGRQMGRLGRSWGCPALRSAVAKPIIDVMKDGQFVFAYYPDQAWLARSALLHCAASRMVRRGTVGQPDSA